MNIFYLHGVSSFGGSTKSLIELYSQLKLYGINGTALCPSGFSEQALSNVGMTTHKVKGLAQFDNTLYGHYRGLRWIILLREIAFILPTLFALFKIKIKKNKFDMIHANEITLLPIAILAKKLFNCPLVVHIRSVQRGNSQDIRSRVLFHLLKKHANSVIVIDETVKDSLPKHINVKVIHNGINLPERFEPVNQKRLPDVIQIGIVGTLLRLKGIYEFLEAARIVLNEHGSLVHFIVVGDNARSSKGISTWFYKKLGFSDDVMSDMLRFISTHKLENHFTIKGFVNDVRTVYSELDILCFPSYLNAAGRPVFEAALFGIPSVVAIREAKNDTIIDKVTGICIQEANPKALAEAIDFLVKNPQDRIQLGKNAQKLAFSNFDIKTNAKRMVDIYKEQLSV